MIKKLSLILWITFTASVLRAAAVNDLAPIFPYVNSKGEKRTSEDFKGKVVFVNFWASWCAPCQIELPKLNQLASDYKSKNVFLIAINLDKDSGQAKSVLRNIGYDKMQMNVLWDPESKSVSAFNPEAMPSSFIIDPKGIVRYIHVGYHKQDPEKWRNELDELLKEPTDK